MKKEQSYLNFHVRFFIYWSRCIVFARKDVLYLYVPVSHTNGQVESIKNIVGVVMNPLVGMGPKPHTH